MPNFAISLCGPCSEQKEKIGLKAAKTIFIGAVSSGKSMLINAILGRYCSPGDAVESTMLPHYFRFGNDERIKVHHKDGNNFDLPIKRIRDFTQSPQPDIDHLVVRVASDFLQGRELLDVPGLGSTRREGDLHNEMSMELRETADSCVYLYETGSVALDHMVPVPLPQQPVICVVNKIDALVGTFDEKMPFQRIDNEIKNLKEAIRLHRYEAMDIDVIGCAPLIGMGAERVEDELLSIILATAKEHKPDVLRRLMQRSCLTTGVPEARLPDSDPKTVIQNLSKSIAPWDSSGVRKHFAFPFWRFALFLAHHDRGDIQDVELLRERLLGFSGIREIRTENSQVDATRSNRTAARSSRIDSLS